MSRRSWLLAALVAMLAVPAVAAADGITNGGSDLRDGWYGNQPDLSPDLVSGGTFGQLWDQAVDGQVYAQPLVHNGRVIVATEKNKVYSFNAETGTQSWVHTLSPSAPWQSADIGCTDLQPDVGVTATPVIDPDTGTIYLTHKSYDPAAPTNGAWWMDALDPATGDERPGFPVKIQGTADNGPLPRQTFNGHAQLQRAGLLLMDGVVYAAFGSLCDLGTWQGWVFGVTTAGSIQTKWVAMEHDSGAGIWQAGSGIMSDGSGRLFVSTGNQGAPWGPRAGNLLNDTLAESVIRLGVGADGKLAGKDFFAPYDAYTLDEWDADFASGGVTALRDDVFGTSSLPHLALAVGKAGYLYMLNRDDLGGIGMGPNGGDAVVQRLGPYGGVWSRPGVWPGDGGYVYVPTASGAGSTAPSGSAGNLHVYKYGVTGSGQPSLSHLGASSDAFGFGSSAPVITSNGTTSGTAVMWTVWMANGSGTDAQLRAYDAKPNNDGSPRLLKSWPVGQAAKFNPPGVGDGRIYVGARDNRIRAFGAPVDTRISGGSTTFPATTVGSTSAPRNVTLVANGTVTVNSISASPSTFSVDTSGAGLPHAMVADDQLVVPMTFAPTQVGLAGGTLTVATDQGTFTFTLSGQGQASGPLLQALNPVIAFGGLPIGQVRDDTVVLQNLGSTDVTISSVTLPAPPFSVTDAPTAGTTIAPQQSINIPVHFAPTALGTFDDDLVVTSNGGTQTVGLTGAAANGPKLTLQTSVAFGDVVLGQSATKTFTVANTGDLPLQIMKSKPPVSGPIVALDGLDEGTTIAAGESRTIRVQFTPAQLGAAAATWPINANDTSGSQTVTFTGNGIAQPVDPGTLPPSDPIYVPPPTPPLPPAKVAAGLRITKITVSRTRSSLTIAGTLSRSATGKLKATLSAKVKRKTVKGTKSATPKAGRVTIKLTVPKALRAVRRASLMVAFAGDARVSPQTRRTTVKLRR